MSLLFILACIVIIIADAAVQYSEKSSEQSVTTKIIYLTPNPKNSCRRLRGDKNNCLHEISDEDEDDDEQVEYTHSSEDDYV